VERLPLRQVTGFGLLALALAAGASHPAVAARSADGGARMRPPAQVSCGHGSLTSYFGHVVAYRRSARQAWLRIATDYGTTEEVTVPLASATDTSRFLMHGQPFGTRHWAAIENRPGILRNGTRATAWVCLGGKQPAWVDWNGAAE
jgi:hypothetical protein